MNSVRCSETSLEPSGNIQPQKRGRGWEVGEDRHWASRSHQENGSAGSLSASGTGNSRREAGRFPDVGAESPRRPPSCLPFQVLLRGCERSWERPLPNAGFSRASSFLPCVSYTEQGRDFPALCAPLFLNHQ